MDSVKEVLIVSDSGSKDANCFMYDIVTGVLVETYKEGHSKRNGLDYIGQDYLISAFEDKPKIKIWRLGHSTTDFYKITTPGVVSALAVSKCGQYCVAGIGNLICIWEIASGNLLAKVKYHSQDITCVRFSSDGSHVITGGKDGLVFVFFLTDALKKRSSPTETPRNRFIWKGHLSEITDIYVGCMGIYSRVATSSLDRTCRIYDLDSGYHLCTIHVKVPITCVTMDLSEYFLFLGTDEGTIYRINLFNMNESNLYEDDTEQNKYEGHTKEITCLSVSHSGCYLVSGSKDKEYRLWNILNFACIRHEAFPGHVTNVIASRVPPGIKNKNYMPHICVEEFKREISPTDDQDALTHIIPQNLSVFHIGAPDNFFDSKVLNCSTEKMPRIVKDSYSVDELSSVNNSLYSFALTDIFVKADSSESN